LSPTGGGALVTQYVYIEVLRRTHNAVSIRHGDNDSVWQVVSDRVSLPEEEWGCGFRGMSKQTTSAICR